MTAAGRRRTIPSSSEMLVLRDRLNMGRQRKTVRREPEKRALLLELALRKIENAERHNFELLGFRRRRVSTGTPLSPTAFAPGAARGEG